MTNTLSGLPTLPVELLSKIFVHLDRLDFVVLSRVCHLLYEPATAELYKHVEVSLNSYASQRPTLHIFARALQQRKGLGQLVESFKAVGGLPDVDATSFHALTWLKDVGYAASEDACMDSLTVKILSEMPRLKNLELGINLLTDSELLGNFLMQQCVPDGRGITKWPDLTSVILGNDLSEEGQKHEQDISNEELYGRKSAWSLYSRRHIHPHLFVSFFSLPQLVNLDVILPASILTFDWDKGPQVILHSLQTLILRSTACREQVLLQLLKRTPVLENLKFEHFWEPGRKWIYDHPLLQTPRPSGFRAALDLVSETLTSLTLRLEVCQYFYEHDPYNEPVRSLTLPGSLGSLRSFRKLKKLETAMEFLFDHFPTHKENTVGLLDLLPVSLEHLILNDDAGTHPSGSEWTEPSYLATVLSDVADGNTIQTVPELSTVCCSLRWYHPADMINLLGIISGYRSICRDKGIQLEEM